MGRFAEMAAVPGVKSFSKSIDRAKRMLIDSELSQWEKKRIAPLHRNYGPRASFLSAGDAMPALALGGLGGYTGGGHNARSSLLLVVLLE